MNSLLRWFKLVALATVSGSLLFSGAVSAGGYSMTQASQVTLTAFSAKATYARGKPIVLLLVLKNTGGAPIDLSDQLEGTIQVTSLKKDGVDVPIHTSFVLSYESLSFLLKQGLQSIAPGHSIPIAWVSESDPELGGEALGTVQLEQQGVDQVTYYAVNAPGTYELSVVYELPALSGLASAAFRGKTNEAVVTFKVAP